MTVYAAGPEERPPGSDDGRGARERLFLRLNELDIETQTVEHPALHTVEQSQALRGSIPGGHSKNLFLKCKKGSLWLLVCEEDAPIDLKRMHKRLGSGRLSFGKPDLLMEVLQVTPGSVTPFALMNDSALRVQPVLEAGLMRHDRLNFHPLENTATTTISRADLLRFIDACGHEARVLELTSPGED